MGQPTDGMMVAAVPPFRSGSLQAHDAGAESGNDIGMLNGRVGIFAKIAPHPGNSLAAHDVIGVDHVVEPGRRRHMSANHNHRFRRELAHDAAHLTHLADIDDDRRNSDDIVFVGLQLAREVFAGGKIQHRARRGDILLNHHDPPRAVEHAQRKSALRARHLVVVKLHRVDGAGAELIVLRIRTEYRTEKYARTLALGVNGSVSDCIVHDFERSEASWRKIQ